MGLIRKIFISLMKNVSCRKRIKWSVPLLISFDLYFMFFVNVFDNQGHVNFKHD